MSGRLVSQADRQHHCNPGWTLDNHGHWHPPQLHAFAPGDVWQCDCGRTWLAKEDPLVHAIRGQQAVKGSVIWKAETTRQARRRARRAPHTNGDTP